MKSFVVDASVAAKWCLPATGEPLAVEAQELLDQHARGRIGLVVPDLFWAELGNVLWKAVRQNRVTERDAEASMVRVRQLGLLVVPAANLLVEALTAALRSGRSVYDCLYIVTAMAKRVLLLTADERLVNATGVRFPVRWLGALPGIL